MAFYVELSGKEDFNSTVSATLKGFKELEEIIDKGEVALKKIVEIKSCKCALCHESYVPSPILFKTVIICRPCATALIEKYALRVFSKGGEKSGQEILTNQKT